MDIFSLHLKNHPPSTTVNNDRPLTVGEIELDSTSTTVADRLLQQLHLAFPLNRNCCN